MWNAPSIPQKMLGASSTCPLQTDTKPWSRSGLGVVGEGDWSVGRASRCGIALPLRTFFYHAKPQRREEGPARPVIVQRYLGDEAPVTEIDGYIIPPRHGGAVGVAEQQRDRRRRWRGTRRLSQSRGHTRSKPCANIISRKGAESAEGQNDTRLSRWERI